MEDEDIIQKLTDWGVSPASPIKRRMWPGSRILDGTRFLKVKFNDKVQSLPYSTKFSTAVGTDLFRVIHDRQVKVCKLCRQPGHILRDCPDFQCGGQGHYAIECLNKTESKCMFCRNVMSKCGCNEADEASSVPSEDGSLAHSVEERGQMAESEAGSVRSENGKENSGMGADARPTTAAGVLGSETRGVPRLAECQDQGSLKVFDTRPREESEKTGLVIEPGNPTLPDLGSCGTPHAVLNSACESDDDPLGVLQSEDMESDQLPAAQSKFAPSDFPPLKPSQVGLS